MRNKLLIVCLTVCLLLGAFFAAGAEESGYSRVISARSGPAADLAKRSGRFLARLLGRSSAKKKTISVRIRVAAAVAALPNRRSAQTVVTALARM